jgi:hypothetical protein
LQAGCTVFGKYRRQYHGPGLSGISVIWLQIPDLFPTGHELGVAVFGRDNDTDACAGECTVVIVVERTRETDVQSEAGTLLIDYESASPEEFAGSGFDGYMLF